LSTKILGNRSEFSRKYIRGRLRETSRITLMAATGHGKKALNRAGGRWVADNQLNDFPRVSW
jgi:hypothetical protein